MQKVEFEILLMISCPLIFGKVGFMQTLLATWLKSNVLPRYSLPLMKKIEQSYWSFYNLYNLLTRSMTTSLPGSRTRELPCGIDSLSWFVLYVCIWVWFYWIDAEALLKVLSNHFPAWSKMQLSFAVTYNPEERCQVTGIGWWILQGSCHQKDAIWLRMVLGI